MPVRPPVEPAWWTSGSKEDVTDVLDQIRKLDRSRVDPEIIRQIRDGLLESVAQFETLEHDSLVRHLHSRRAWAEEALKKCGHPGQRQHLYEIARIASGVLGYVAEGRSEFALARAYWSQSLVKIDLAFSFLWSGNQDLEHASMLAREALEASAGRPAV